MAILFCVALALLMASLTFLTRDVHLAITGCPGGRGVRQNLLPILDLGLDQDRFGSDGERLEGDGGFHGFNAFEVELQPIIRLGLEISNRLMISWSNK